MPDRDDLRGGVARIPRQTMARQVVVTGLGVVSPLGVGLDAHWDGLLRGCSAVSRLERLTRLGFPTDVAAEVSAEKMARCLPYLPRKQLKLYSRTTMLAMTAAILAAEDAGLSAPVAEPARAGVILATLFVSYPIQSILRGLPGVESAEDPCRVDMGLALRQCLKGLNPLDMSLKVVPNLTAGHIAITFGLRGICRTLSDAWTGGIHAIGQALWAIREGELDLAFCGGAECPLEELVFADLRTTDLLAQGATPPEQTCRPFGNRRSGLVAGEGAAVLVLEAREHAERRGARIQGELAGFGAASGAATPDGLRESCQRAVRSALADSRRDTVDAISANGDGRRATDLAEAEALRATFGARNGFPVVYATKGMHGSLFSAAGPLEVATAVRGIEHGIIPPSVNCGDPDPACGLPLSGEVPFRQSRLGAVLVDTLGAFGEAACVVVASSD